MRSAVGAPVVEAVEIEVEMTNGTVEPQLPGRKELREKSSQVSRG